MPLFARFDVAPFPLETFVRPVAAISVEVRHKALGLEDALWIGALDPNDRAAMDRHALHEPSLRVVVIDGIVLSGAVIPHCNGMGSPVEPELVFGDQSLMK